MDICINFYLKLDINKNFGSIIVIINNLNEQWVNSQIWTLDAVETPSDLNLPKVTKISSKGEIEGFVFSRQNSTKDPIIRPLSLSSSSNHQRRKGEGMARRWNFDIPDSSSSHPTVADPPGFARSTPDLVRILLLSLSILSLSYYPIHGVCASVCFVVVDL